MYREHDNTHLIHSLERQFFRFVIRQINYNSINSNTLAAGMLMPMEQIVDIFCKRKGLDPEIKRKQLLFYLKKWYFVRSKSSEWERNYISLEKIPVRYIQLIPERVKTKLYRVNIKVERDSIYYEI